MLHCSKGCISIAVRAALSETTDLSMYQVHTLIGRCFADLRVAVAYQWYHDFSREIKRPISRTHTKVRHTDTGGKVKELPAISESDVRSLALGDDGVDDATKALGDVLLAKLDEGRVGLRGRGHVAGVLEVGGGVSANASRTWGTYMGRDAPLRMGRVPGEDGGRVGAPGAGSGRSELSAN